MQSYIESKLIGVHRMTFTYRLGEKCATLFAGIALWLILPYLHIGMQYFVEDKIKGVCLLSDACRSQPVALYSVS